MYFVWGTIHVKPGAMDRYAALMAAYAEGCRREPGCVYFDIGVSPASPDTMLLAECWDSEAAHGAHKLLDTFHENQRQLREFATGVTLDFVATDGAEHLDLHW